jgi:hypothetical protein
MSEREVPAGAERSLSEEGALGKVLLGGALGAAVGLLAGGALFSSVVVAMFGAALGLVGGMIAAAKPAETA